MKSVAIHQPQYIPWAPYFDKALQADVFVLLDSVQFEKNGRQNRNQIKTPQGVSWLTLPVSFNSEMKIKDVTIADSKIAIRHLKTLEMSYQKAPFYRQLLHLVQKPLEAHPRSLSDLCCDTVIQSMRYLGYSGEIIRSSELKAEGRSSDLILNICNELQASRYFSGQGGKNYLEEDTFAQAGIELLYQKYECQVYRQIYENLGFISNLSLLDMLFNVGHEAIDVIKSGRRGWEHPTALKS